MADRYLVDTGNWNSTARWSTTSGGASGASIPGAGDNVFLDANSPSGVSTLTTITVASVDCTGFTGTLAGTQALTIAGADGEFKLSDGMTYTRTGQTTFSGSGTMKLTSAGHVLGNVVMNAAGAELVLQDNLSCTASNGSTLNLTAGTLTVGANDVETRIFNASNSNVRTLNMGSGTWTLSYAGTQTTIWNFSAQTNLTFNKETANIVVALPSSASVTLNFNPSGREINDLRIVGVQSELIAVQLTGISEVAKLEIEGPVTIILPNDMVAGDLQLINSRGQYTLIQNSGGVQRTISQATGVIDADFLALQGIIATGGATFYAGRHSIDLDGNTGWIFDNPVTHEVTGVTRDKDGSPLGDVDLWLLRHEADGSLWNVSTGTSDGSGNYTLDAYRGTSNHVVVARKEGATNVFDVTDFTVQPTAV